MALTVKGQRSNGFASLPRRKPKGLVVVAHGYGWTAAAWKTKLQRIAAGDGAVAVAPDFRGLRFLPPAQDGFPRSRGIPLRNAVADLTAYGQKYARACPSVRTVVLVGYSLGGAYSGNVLMSRPKGAGGRPLFDYYVGMEALQDVFSEFEIAKRYRMTRSSNEASRTPPTSLAARSTKRRRRITRSIRSSTSLKSIHPGSVARSSSTGSTMVSCHTARQRT